MSYVIVSTVIVQDGQSHASLCTCTEIQTKLGVTLSSTSGQELHRVTLCALRCLSFQVGAKCSSNESK